MDVRDVEETLSDEQKELKALYEEAENEGMSEELYYSIQDCESRIAELYDEKDYLIGK